jgi:hypothetical protein
MNPPMLQQWIDEFHATSLQLWAFRLVAVVAPLAALLAAAGANGRLWPAGLFIVTVLAGASAVRPDTHTGLIVVVVLVWHWLATVDGVGGPWLPLAAVCLLVFHAVIALSASVPIGGVLPMATVVQWIVRTALAASATVGMWALVAVLDGRDAPGNGLLTALALAIVAGAAVTIRSRSLDRR